MHKSNNYEKSHGRENRNIDTVRRGALWAIFGALVVAGVVNNVPNNFSSEPALDQTSTSVDTSQSTNSLRP